MRVIVCRMSVAATCELAIYLVGNTTLSRAECCLASAFVPGREARGRARRQEQRGPVREEHVLRTSEPFVGTGGVDTRDALLPRWRKTGEK